MEALEYLQKNSRIRKKDLYIYIFIFIHEYGIN